MEQYNVTGMSCAACSARVEKAVMAVEGVTSCSVSLLTNSMGVEGIAASERIIEAVTKAGYGASLKGTEKVRGGEKELEDKETPKLKRRLVMSLCFLAPLMYLSMGHMMWGWPLPPFLAGNHVAMGLAQMLLTIAIMWINQKFFISGFWGFVHKAPNMDSLVAMGSGAAFFYSVYALFAMTGAVVSGDQAAVMTYMDEFYFESAGTILTLITVGKMLEARSKGRTTDALKGLMNLAPKMAVLQRNGEEVRVPVESVQKGDCFLVRPGESIPVDGVVIEGSSAVNEAALTGESIPTDKRPGDPVSAATMNQSGFLVCEATRVGEDTTLAQIIKMVSDAAATKAPIAKIADKVSGIFVPAVLGIAAVTFLVWMAAGADFGFALARAISVLVISCPCALGLATPVAIMVGNGVGAKNGILFKTAASLEETGRIRIVALDKTGTITRGEPRVTDVYPAQGVLEAELLEAAYSLEKKSEHPLAKAVLEYGKTKGIREREITAFGSFAGNGLSGKLEGEEVVGGSLRFLSETAAVEKELEEQAERMADQGKTPLFFSKGGRILGMIAVADVMKEDSAEAIRELRAMGITVVMLTGDNERTAKAIGVQAGVDEVVAGVMPAQKEAVIRKLQSFGKTAMVGDGINDAPALTAADMGIAIGAGTDIAMDAADVVLMKSSLKDVPAAIRLSHATLRNIRENLFWAFFYNVLGIPLAAGIWIPVFGWTLNPMFGAAAMSLSSFFVVSNALRLNWIKPYDASKDKKMTGSGKNVPGPLGVGADLNPEITESVTTAGSDETAERGMESETQKEAETQKEEQCLCLKIGGMMCEHCEKAVKAALETIEGVEEAAPDYHKGIALVKCRGEVPEEKFRAAIESEDYEYLGMDS